MTHESLSLQQPTMMIRPVHSSSPASTSAPDCKAPEPNPVRPTPARLDIVQFSRQNKASAGETALRAIFETVVLHQRFDTSHRDYNPQAISHYLDQNRTEIERLVTERVRQNVPFTKTLTTLINDIQKQYPTETRSVAGWKPAMTEDEANAWAQKSHYQGPMYHLTTQKNSVPLREKGFGAMFSRYGFNLFVTPDKAVLNDLLNPEKPSYFLKLAEKDMRPHICRLKLNIPYPMADLAALEAQFGDRITEIEKHLSDYPLRIPPDQKHRRRIIWNHVLHQAGLRAVYAAYRKDREVMLTDPKLVTLLLPKNSPQQKATNDAQ
ncbi:hypothetical protein [Vampirovibrio sp.]|uniref:hypothetical protein n=1 Tax=Vampirovibrio sp. TaxID=2717857 RepID=UPI003593C838